MRLRELRVWGFGTFADTRVRGLAPGLNVLHGPNEFGKTTLLEFVRRVLFGFPTKRGDDNPYPNVRGGRYGGQLVCEMRDGRILTISRTTGKSGGAVSVEDERGAALTQDAFYAALGNASSDLYQNLFSVALTQLHDDNPLALPEVKDRLYGAGLGLGEVSVTKLKETFSDAAEKLFKPRGSTQRMNVIAGNLTQLERKIRERTAQLAGYDEAARERERLAAESERLRQQQRELQAGQRTLAGRKSLYPTFAGLRAAEQELANLGAVPELPDESMHDLERGRQSVASLDEKLKETQARLASKRTEAASLAFDPALLQHEKEIKALSRSLAQYRDARRDLPVLTRDQEEALAQVRRSVEALGAGWTEERVRSFNLTDEQGDALRRRQDALQTREKAAEKAADRLDDYRVQTRASRARPGLPAVYRAVGLAILGLGVAGCVYFGRSGQALPAVLSGVAAALGLVVALSLGSSSGPLRDKAIEELEQERREAARLLEEERSAWAAFVESLGFAPSLSPEAVAGQLQALRALQVSLREVDERNVRIRNMKTVVETTEGLFASVGAALAEPVPAADIAAGIETMDARLDNAQDLRTRSETVRREIEQLEGRGASLTAELAAARTAFDGFLRRHGVSDAEEFVALYKRSARARQLRSDVAKSRLAIQAAAGVGESYGAFLASLESTSPEELAARLSGIEEELATVEGRLAAVNQRIGGLDTELSELVSSEQLLAWETEAEELRQQLRDAHRDWIRARIGLRAVEQAVSRYETTRQPAVIREAQESFSRITGGRFTTLLNPVGGNELRVRDASGGERAVPGELSRGTLEQLYLAMRLGLIAQYEQNAEPLPVIMDDILVNFDDDRGPLAVKALAEFAMDRQVIVMTCHDATRQLYLEAGATALIVEKNAPLR